MKLLIAFIAAAIMINTVGCGLEEEPLLVPMKLDHSLSHTDGGPQDMGFPELPEPEEQDNIEAEPVNDIVQTMDTLKADTENLEKVELMQQFFSDTLFIGDSRTVGMARYGEVTTADYFAATGMSVFNLFKEKVKINGIGTVKLDELLARKQYGKIYIMLGINELGYSLNSIGNKYTEVLSVVKALQPEAEICLQANLHVSKGRSEKDPTFNNIQINALNDIIKGISEENGMGWLDVNPIFDDESGALTQDYTFDHTHVLGKYYKLWNLWIYNCGTM